MSCHTETVLYHTESVLYHTETVLCHTEPVEVYFQQTHASTNTRFDKDTLR